MLKLNLFFEPKLTINMLLLAALLTPAFLLKYRAFQLLGASEVVMISVTNRFWNVFGALELLYFYNDNKNSTVRFCRVIV